MGVLSKIGSATGSFLDDFFSLDRFQKAGQRVGRVSDAVVGGLLALTALGVRAAGHVLPAALRRGARAVRRLRPSDLIALGIAAGAAALLIRSKVWQLLTAGGLLVLAGILRRLKENEQQRLVEVLGSMSEEERRDFVEAANRGDVPGAKEVLARATS